MELELLFSDQKWNILKALSEGKYSPIQLAQMLNTTMANISQQMRLLEAANLVKKEKIRNREKGKPRTLFSLTEETAYLIPTMHNFAQKKLIKVNDHKKIILKIWFIENEELQQAVEKLYQSIRHLLKHIKLILLVNWKEIVIATESIDAVKKSAQGSEIPVKVLSPQDAEKQFGKKVYSPENLILHISKNGFERKEVEGKI